MCQKLDGCYFEIQREISNSSKTFVTVDRSPINYETGDIRLKFHKFSISKLCNNNQDCRIKFSVIGLIGQELNSVITTVNEIEGGKRTFLGKSGAQLVFS